MIFIVIYLSWYRDYLHSCEQRNWTINMKRSLRIWKCYLQKFYLVCVHPLKLKYNAFEIVFAILFLKGGSKGTTRKEKEGFQSFGWVWRKNEWGL